MKGWCKYKSKTKTMLTGRVWRTTLRNPQCKSIVCGSLARRSIQHQVAFIVFSFWVNNSQNVNWIVMNYILGLCIVSRADKPVWNLMRLSQPCLSQKFICSTIVLRVTLRTTPQALHIIQFLKYDNADEYNSVLFKNRFFYMSDFLPSSFTFFILAFNYKEKVITFTNWQLKWKGFWDWNSYKYKFKYFMKCVHNGALFHWFKEI